MSTAILEQPVVTALDPRLRVFLGPQSREVFRSVATPAEIWRADPFDVETIHVEARQEFERLLNRTLQQPPPASGAILALHGEAGSGKTHLMRAFRTRAHQTGSAYCVYLQMASEISNYAKYLLKNVIDGLQQPYEPETSDKKGLERLTTAFYEHLCKIVLQPYADRRHQTLDVVCELLNSTANMNRCIDKLQEHAPFHDCDMDFLRVMLHIHRGDARVRNRALRWLRCEELNAEDRLLIGDVPSRTDDEESARMLKAIAHFVQAVQGVPLVLLVDQLEDMADLSEPAERFRKVVNELVQFTEGSPNALVVLACLKDYFQTNLPNLTKSRFDRLTRDPAPIDIKANRHLDEIRAMAEKRLAALYEAAELELDPNTPLYPFTEQDLPPLNNLSTRDVLYFFQQHAKKCADAGMWLPTGSIAPPPPPPVPSTLEAEWNSFYSTFQANVPDEEAELVEILAVAINDVSCELPPGMHFECNAKDNVLELETHLPNDHVNKMLVGICNANIRGRSFLNQLEQVQTHAGENSVTIVRTTDFPRTGKALEIVGQMLRSHGKKVVAADAEWRQMQAFAAFRQQAGTRPEFLAWQKSSRPLGELESLQKILSLNELLSITSSPVAESASDAPAHVLPPVEKQPAPTVNLPQPKEHIILEKKDDVRIGQTTGSLPTPASISLLDLTKHAAFLGGSGSGKTTAALNIIEQLLLQDIPVVLLDRKGDLCRYAAPEAWERPLDEDRAQIRAALRSKLDVAIYTPGDERGRSLAIPIVPEGFAKLGEVEREQYAHYAAAALGSMIGFRSTDADKAQRAILAKAIETLGANSSSEITLTALRELIETRDNALLNAIGGGFPDKHYNKLAERLLTLELNNKRLLNGAERLNVDALLGIGRYSRPGRVKLSVISTKFLGDAATIDFWVSQLLTAVARWSTQSPQSRLQAVFLFDEADAYLPAVRVPATKAPMENLLKRGRSAGVGVFLATQSPGDLDYRCKENILSWLIGRVKEKTAIDKLRPLLAAAKTDVSARLAGQAAGDFYLARETSVISIHSDESLIKTEQLPEALILELARCSK